MDAFYAIDFSYPDGHVEEVRQRFKTAQDAVEFGKDMLNQVRYTESFHGDSDGKQEPYFYVIKIENGKRKVVFDSHLL